jgi:hypothetical protein
MPDHLIHHHGQSSRVSDQDFVVLFYVDFTEYSIFGHFADEDEPPLARLAPERAP